MADRIGVGIVGTSWWADLIHRPALASHPRTDIAAICGRNSERAEVMAEKYGIRYFVDCILDDRPVSPSIHDGWKTQQVIDEAIESDRLGRWIEL
jgi:predicted dehydrogenase